jgi:sulfate adenylyltransferase
MNAMSCPTGDGPLRWTLRPRQQRTLEQLLDGRLSPLRGFLGRRDYDSVLRTMQLADGTPCPFPVTLDVDEPFAARLDRDTWIALCDTRGAVLAQLEVADVYFPDHLHEVRSLYGNMSRHHPAIVELLRQTGPVYLGGRVQGESGTTIALGQHTGSAHPPAIRTPRIERINSLADRWYH